MTLPSDIVDAAQRSWVAPVRGPYEERERGAAALTLSFRGGPAVAGAGSLR
ncbi:hypothetical protein ACIP9H_40670 [Streptomyces sp. NPDC088732]|uniref:hypothetical protein n=1 Tax=Streptomyces sp. NPDC088732 TaxID=3365879 RepID=UPI0037F30F63